MQLVVVRELLGALEYVHELRDDDGSPLGLVHRDVSPQNVFVTYDGAVKLLDFGVMKTNDPTRRTLVGVVKGKLTYMAPEQVQGHPVDRRTDLFSIGVLLWEALAGQRLWQGVPEVAIIGQLVSGRLKSPSSVKSDVPPDLERICMRAMAFAPDDRYPTAAAMRDDLDAFIGRMTVSVSRRDLAQLVSSLFGAERRERRAQIEAALRDADDLLPEGRDGATSMSSTFSPLPEQTPFRTLASSPAAARRMNAILLPIAAAVLVGVVVGGGAAFTRPGLPRATSSTTLAAPVSSPSRWEHTSGILAASATSSAATGAASVVATPSASERVNGVGATDSQRAPASSGRPTSGPSASPSAAEAEVGRSVASPTVAPPRRSSSVDLGY